MTTNSLDREQPRRAARSSEGRVLGGVAAGLAHHLGLDVGWVRAAFVIATAIGGLGVAMYAGLWMVLPSDARFRETAPGLEAAARQGRRPRPASRLDDRGWLVALVVAALGTVLLVQMLLGGGLWLWPVLLGVGGLALLWRQADEAQRERWMDTTGRIDPMRAVLGRGGAAAYARLAAGLVLLVGALALFAVQTGHSGVTSEVLVAGLLGVLGLALTVGPWLFRLAADLSEERAARVRSQERADVAAHLHDSVLQTLALIQKHADDGRAVTRLARAQERDLRSWMYADPAPVAASTVGALRAATAEVEDGHGVPVELVTVGDTSFDDTLAPLVLATREAMVNAAKHSGAEKIDVYVETSAEQVEVFVRDRGRGFDPDGVPHDRLGVRHSIIDRMARHGGLACLRSTPGDGTEVHLTMPLSVRTSEESR